MSELDFDKEFPKYENLAIKIFSETVCQECQRESNPMPETDNMGRPMTYKSMLQ